MPTDSHIQGIREWLHFSKEVVSCIFIQINRSSVYKTHTIAMVATKSKLGEALLVVSFQWYSSRAGRAICTKMR